LFLKGINGRERRRQMKTKGMRRLGVEKQDAGTSALINQGCMFGNMGNEKIRNRTNKDDQGGRKCRGSKRHYSVRNFDDVNSSMYFEETILSRKE
jgi:hypothetical protein